MRIRLVKAEHQQFISDSAVGLFSIAVLGLAGLLINVVIARYYDAAVLGAFNQVFAIYILGSQFATFGVQSSVLKYAAQHYGDDQELKAILRAGLIIVAAIALLVSLGLFAVRHAIGAALDSAEVARGVGYAAPGLWAFALNKYLLNTLNGLQRMKAYSLFSSLRYGLLLTVVAGAAAMGVPGGVLPVIFTFAETLLLLMLFLHLRSLFSGRVAHGSTRTWCRAHLQFGLRSVTGGAVSELNTRIDVLVLGIFAEDRIVGIFSFAAILAEGLLQIPLVIKRQADPILTPLILRREHDMLTASFRTWRRWTYVLMGAASACAIPLFPLLAEWLTSNRELQDGWAVFVVLLIGGTIQSGYVPVSGILNQGGYPWQQTLYLLVIFASNLLLNLTLIPFWGPLGAAFSTATVYVASIFYLKLLVRRSLGIFL